MGVFMHQSSSSNMPLFSNHAQSNKNSIHVSYDTAWCPCQFLEYHILRHLAKNYVCEIHDTGKLTYLDGQCTSSLQEQTKCKISPWMNQDNLTEW
jgi:hypothetical protein